MAERPSECPECGLTSPCQVNKDCLWHPHATPDRAASNRVLVMTCSVCKAAMASCNGEPAQIEHEQDCIQTLMWRTKDAAN